MNAGPSSWINLRTLKEVIKTSQNCNYDAPIKEKIHISDEMSESE